MGIKDRALNLACRFLNRAISVVGGAQAPRVSACLAESLAPIVTKFTDFGSIKFYCPGKLLEWRAQTLLTKEPETIAWIHTFQNNEVFWDIGANVGVYSLFAAKKGQTVLSFEPSPGNYYVLCKNIETNELGSRVFAYCIALTDVTKLDLLFMANTELGGALSSFGQSIDWQGNAFTAQFQQAMVGFSVDNFIECFNPPFPNHIKIDVDGIEDKIVRGARKTLSDQRIKSVLIELDTARQEYLKNVSLLLEDSGLRLLKKEHATDCDTSIFASVNNHIFVRAK